MSSALILAENDGISIFGASILGASNLGMSNAGALGASGILKSILGACSNQPVSPVRRDNLFHALSLAENDGISIFGASGSFGASGILKDGASGASNFGIENDGADGASNLGIDGASNLGACAQSNQ